MMCDKREIEMSDRVLAAWVLIEVFLSGTAIGGLVFSGALM